MINADLTLISHQQEKTRRQATTGRDCRERERTVRISYSNEEPERLEKETATGVWKQEISAVQVLICVERKPALRPESTMARLRGDGRKISMIRARMWHI